VRWILALIVIAALAAVAWVVVIYDDSGDSGPNSARVEQRMLSQPYRPLGRRPDSALCRPAAQAGYFECTISFDAKGKGLATKYGYDVRVSGQP
jgi:hypothetical protein